MASAPRAAADATADDARTARFAASLWRLSLAFFGIATAVALYAAAEGRGLHADGAHYLVKMLTAEGFNFAEPSRLATLFLMQAPTVLGLKLGLVGLDGARLLFCLTLELMPLVLLALCYAALPAERKHFFYFPLLHYLAGTLSAAASPIVESLVAAEYFWLLFVLILFGPYSRRRLIMALVLAVPLAVLHESVALLGFFLAAAAGWRARREPDRGRAKAFWLVAGLCALAALVQIGFIAMPRSAEQRDGLFAAFVYFFWIYGQGGGFNVPAILGLLALLLLNVIPAYRPARRSTGGEARGVWLAVAVLAAAALTGIVMALAIPQTVMPWLHFAARHNPGLYAVGFAAAVFAVLLWPRLGRLWIRPATLAVCGIVAFGALGWHTVQIAHWSSFVTDVRGILAASRGLVPREAAAASFGRRDRRIFLNHAWSWSMPELSIVLAPKGRVAALIGRQIPVPWGWDTSDPTKIPRSRFFDTSDYRAALADARTKGARP